MTPSQSLWASHAHTVDCCVGLVLVEDGSTLGGADAGDMLCHMLRRCPRPPRSTQQARVENQTHGQKVHGKDLFKHHDAICHDKLLTNGFRAPHVTARGQVQKTPTLCEILPPSDERAPPLCNNDGPSLGSIIRC